MNFFSLANKFKPPTTFDNDFTALEPILSEFRKAFIENGFKSRSAFQCEDEKEAQYFMDRCILNWLDDLFESLDTISDYPPPVSYKDYKVFPMDKTILEGMVKYLRKLCLLRYKVVPKLLREEDFWCWVYFGIEQTRLKFLQEQPIEAVKIMNEYVQAHLREKELAEHRKLIVEERMKNEQLTDQAATREDRSTVLTFATAPEKTLPLIQKGVSSLVRSIKSVGNDEEPVGASRTETQDIEIEFMDGPSK